MRVEIIEGDATCMDVDVLALKYAQARYGIDSYVYECLLDSGVKEGRMSPRPGEYSLVPAVPPIGAGAILFVGTETLWALDYPGIRSLARTFLSSLAQAQPQARTIALTLHGANFGLDEGESFESMIAGIVDAVGNGEVPKQLSSVSFVEKKPARAGHLRRILEELVPNGILETAVFPKRTNAAQERLRAAGYASAAKPHVFVAMPFADEFRNFYDYAIQNAVKQSGFLCERIDLTAFTGDILARVQERIRSAALLIADLSAANPNVYLEVGYAWGCGVPCILLVRDSNELLFDVRGQRCVVYDRRFIKDLEEKLSHELQALLVGAE